MGAKAAGMNDPLGNSLVIEVKDLLAKMKIFQHRRPAGADLQRVLVVGDRDALLRGQDGETIFSGLMQFAAFAAPHALIVNFRGILRESSSLIWP